MSIGTKPLIFLEPLSETLKKLKEILEENAEAEGIEIFELDSLEEVNQLIPTIGQSLTLTSSPKKCAMMLQSNRKVVKKLQSKTILLSPKSMPRKTLDKFMKVGLTECIVEPVNPKTLLYKVRLQLRSIAIKKEEDESEMNTRFGEGSHDDADGDTDKKARTEKGALSEGEDEAEINKNKKTEETVMEDYTKPRKNNYQEESIDNYYKGNNKKREEVEIDYGEEKEKQKYKEEAIDGHYKGNLQKAELQEDEEETPKKKTKLELEEEEIEALKHQINLEAEDKLNHNKKKEILEFEEEAKAKKKSVQLDIEEQKENKEKNENEAEDLGGHYKGKVTKELDVEEDDPEFLDKKEEDSIEEDKKKKAAKLELFEDDQEEFLDEVEEEIETKTKKKKPRLEIGDDESKDMHQKAEAFEEEPITKEKRSRLDIAEESEKDPLKKEAILEEEKEKKNHDNIADEIDGYLRGGAAKKGISLEDEDDIYNDDSRAEEIAEKKKKRAALELEEDGIEKDPLLGDKEYDEDLDKKKKAEKLLLDDDSLDRKAGSKSEEGLDKERRKSSYQEDDLGFGKGKGKGSTDKIENASNRSNARADQIKTHYSSKEGLKHGEQDWDVQWEKREKGQGEFPSEKREENSLFIEKEDRGEQTIDYGKLKAEFEGITIDGVANKRKEYGSFDNVAEIKTYKKTILSPEGELEEMEFEEIVTQDEEESGHQVFEPNSLGMEIAIQIQNFYFTKDIVPEDVCEFMHKMVKNQFRGSTLFYSFAHNKDIETTLFNGPVFEEQGAPPKKPSNEELDQMPRKERKEREADYTEDLKEYVASKNNILEDFKNKYSSEFNNWLDYRFPTWKDETFQDPENIFIFPFYEGETILGLGVFIPDSDFNIEKAEALEAVFEVARGIIMTDFHQAKGEGKVRVATMKKEEAPKKKGLFGKLFGSKAS